MIADVLIRVIGMMIVVMIDMFVIVMPVAVVMMVV